MTQLLINFSANFGLDGFGRTVPHAANKKLSEILKKGALVVNQSAVLLIKCVQVKIFATVESGKNLYLFVAKIFANNCASYSPFFKTSPSPKTLPTRQKKDYETDTEVNIEHDE